MSDTASPAHAWGWFVVRAAQHVPKGTKTDPRWKTFQASFFAIVQAVGQAANPDGTGAFLGVDTLAAVGRCNDETVRKVLRAAEAVGLIRKTANARGGKNPKPAVYMVCLPLGANVEEGTGVDWERALFVLMQDRRLEHKAKKKAEREAQDKAGQDPSRDGVEVEAQSPSRDGVYGTVPKIQSPSRDTGRDRHVTDQSPSRDAPTRVHQELDHGMAGLGTQPPDGEGGVSASNERRLKSLGGEIPGDAETHRLAAGVRAGIRNQRNAS